MSFFCWLPSAQCLDPEVQQNGNEVADELSDGELRHEAYVHRYVVIFTLFPYLLLSLLH